MAVVGRLGAAARVAAARDAAHSHGGAAAEALPLRLHQSKRLARLGAVATGLAIGGSASGLGIWSTGGRL